jgi:hypothetical protein
MLKVGFGLELRKAILGPDLIHARSIFEVSARERRGPARDKARAARIRTGGSALLRGAFDAFWEIPAAPLVCELVTLGLWLDRCSRGA